MIYSSYEFLKVERHGPVGWLINNRPDQLNAMNNGMRDEFEVAWKELDADPKVRVIVHTGEGRAFQTGVDVTCVLHETQMPLKRVMKLEIGDTLMFDARPDSVASLRCGEFTVSEGRIGRVDDKIAVQVVSPLRRSKTTIAAFDSLASHLGATT